MYAYIYQRTRWRLFIRTRERRSISIDPDGEKAVIAANSVHGIGIATSSSESMGRVGVGESF